MTPHLALAEAILDAAYWGDRTLADPAWRAAWDACPRASFVPDRYFLWDGQAWVMHERATDPAGWERLVHDPDQPVITQVAGRAPTSSVSAPVLVAAMLGALDVADGMRVLESGTGSGWTACLLAARLGDENVVSVEVDPNLASQARINAKRVGRWPAILVGDGLAGHAQGGLFDRVSATHAVTRIPQAWIGQTLPGGIVAAPVNIGRGVDAFVTLAVAADGSASGPVRFPVAFMGSRTGPDGVGQSRALADDKARSGSTSLDLPAIVAAKELWALQMALPGLDVTGPRLEDGDDTVWATTPDGSWAVAYVPHGAAWDGAVVEQHGPRDIWTLAESAHAAWTAAERPTMDAYGLTVEPDGTHRFWLREPGSEVAVMR